jgi:transcriptional regulator with XRE-family HTH domain
MEENEIGRKIAEYRKGKGLTSRELAKLTDITPSMLSQIEKGTVNPSLQTLKLLAKNLDIPMFMFFMEETNTKSLVVRNKNRKKMVVDNLTYELLSPDFNGNLASVIMNLPPNTQSSEKLWGHKGEEIAYVLTGKVKIHLNDEEYTLDTGDSVKIPTNLKHKWKNPFIEETNILFSVTPPIF